MIRRLLYAVCVLIFGIVFMPIKWVVMGTKGGRQRKKLLKLAKEQNRLLKQQQR